VIDNVLPKVYTASAMVEMPAEDLVTPAAGSMLEPVAFQPQFENVMLSPEFLLAVVKDLGLDKAWAKRITTTDQDQVPDLDALTHMEKLLKLEIKHGTHIVEITAASDVPEEAADIANAMAIHYQSVRAASSGLQPVGKPVRILTRAETPTEPSKPHRGEDIILTVVLAVVLSIIAASFVEIVFLFVRAGERDAS